MKGADEKRAAGQWRCFNPVALFLEFRRKRILTVEPTMFFYMLGYYVFLFFHTQYIYNIFAREEFEKVRNFTGPFDSCMTGNITKRELDPYVNGTSHYIKTKTSYLSIYVNIAGQLPGIIAALLFGSMSDRYGRKPFLVIMGVCSILAAVLLLVSVHYQLSVYSLIGVAAIYSFGGGMPTMITLTNSYIADISSRKWLAVRLGIVESMFFLGGVISVLSIGQWLRHTNCQYLQGPPILYLICNVLMLSYTAFYLPESLSKEERLKRHINRQRSVIKQVVRGLKIYIFRGYSRWRLWFGTIVVGSAYFVTLGSTKVNQLYLINHPLNWQPDILGGWSATVMFSHVIVLMGLLPILIKLKVPVELLAVVGELFAAGTFILLGVLTQTWEAFIVAILMGVRGFIGTTARTSMSRLVSSADQGAMFSVLAVVQAMGFVVGPVVFFFFYPATSQWYSGIVYFLMAALMMIPVPLMLTVLIFRNRPAANYTPPAAIDESTKGEKWSSSNKVFTSQSYTTAIVPAGEKEPLLGPHSWSGNRVQDGPKGTGGSINIPV